MEIATHSPSVTGRERAATQGCLANSGVASAGFEPIRLVAALSVRDHGTAFHPQPFSPLHTWSSKCYLRIRWAMDTTSRWWENKGPDPLAEIWINSRWFTNANQGWTHNRHSTPAISPGARSLEWQMQGSRILASAFFRLYTGGQQTFTQRLAPHLFLTPAISRCCWDSRNCPTSWAGVC